MTKNDKLDFLPDDGVAGAAKRLQGGAILQGTKISDDDMAAMYRATFEGAAPQIVLWDILSKCGIYTNVDLNDTNLVEKTMHHVGQRAVGLHVLARLQHEKTEAQPATQNTKETSDGPE